MISMRPGDDEILASAAKRAAGGTVRASVVSALVRGHLRKLAQRMLQFLVVVR